MKYLVPSMLFVLFAMTILACKRGNIKEDVESKESLKYLKEVEWPKAYAEQDTILLDRILGDDFNMIDQNGAWTDKEFELNWIKKHATQNDSFYYEIKRFDILANGIAIICGTGHIQNDSIKSIYQSSNIFEKINGEWKAILSQVSGFKNID